MMAYSSPSISILVFLSPSLVIQPTIQLNDPRHPTVPWHLMIRNIHTSAHIYDHASKLWYHIIIMPNSIAIPSF
ncbi:hypothetical protein BDF22DRAFT_670137 [Syncephalis plumigaleata]|nr:hypothetical protein BDF22DRAFT_670137 [Syncephalis plumigaleata]